MSVNLKDTELHLTFFWLVRVWNWWPLSTPLVWKILSSQAQLPCKTSKIILWSPLFVDKWNNIVGSVIPTINSRQSLSNVVLRFNSLLNGYDCLVTGRFPIVSNTNVVNQIKLSVIPEEKNEVAILLLDVSKPRQTKCSIFHFTLKAIIHRRPSDKNCWNWGSRAWYQMPCSGKKIHSVCLVAASFSTIS